MTIRFVFVVGPNYSGTSCVAEILYNLGIYMGPEETFRDGEYGRFEDQEFKSLMAGMSTWKKTRTLKNRMERWIDGRIVQGSDVQGVKHPQLSLYLGDVLPFFLAKSFDIRIVCVNRSPKDVAISNLYRFDGRKYNDVLSKVQNMYKKRDEIIKTYGLASLPVDFYGLLEKTEENLHLIAEFCKIKPTKSLIEQAASGVRPEERHVWNGKVRNPKIVRKGRYSKTIEISNGEVTKITYARIPL